MEASNALACAMGLTASNMAVISAIGGTVDDIAMEATVNGVNMLPYLAEKGLEITLREIDGDEAGRTMDAFMWRDLRAYKLDISMTCMDLPLVDAIRVCTSIMPEYVQCTFVTPFTGRITAEFYSNNIPVVCSTVGEHGETLWSGIKFPLIQR